jgi:2-dehydropantoate 2-reductase
VRVLVVGLGGIGGIVTAHLLEQGIELTPLTTNDEIADAVDHGGIKLIEDGEERRVAARAYRNLREGARYDFVLLATQPPQVEAAARRALPYLADHGAMVCFQNGLCEERIAKIAGADRVIGAVVAWGASMLAPGRYERTSSGGFTIGRLDGASDRRLDQLTLLLECIGPVETTNNLLGARWSKLAINCAITSLGAIGGDRLGNLLRQRYVRRLALEVMTETVEVARSHGIQLQKVSGTLDLDWIALTPQERQKSASAGLVRKHALLLAVGARYRRLRSSMLSALERGRTPSVDFLNGEVVDRAGPRGIAVPVNRRIQELVHEIAKGTAKSSYELLRRLYEETRV